MCVSVNVCMDVCVYGCVCVWMCVYGCVCVCVVEMRKKGIKWVQNGMGSEWNGFGP